MLPSWFAGYKGSREVLLRRGQGSRTALDQMEWWCFPLVLQSISVVLLRLLVSVNLHAINSEKRCQRKPNVLLSNWHERLPASLCWWWLKSDYLAILIISRTLVLLYYIFLLPLGCWCCFHFFLWHVRRNQIMIGLRWGFLTFSSCGAWTQIYFWQAFIFMLVNWDLQER